MRWQERQLRQAPRPDRRALLLWQQHRLRLASSRTVRTRISLLTGGVMPLRLRLHRQRLASGGTVCRSRLASRVRVSPLPRCPPRRRKHGTLPRFAASRRRSCCLPRRRRRWTRLCGRSSQRHPPTPPPFPPPTSPLFLSSPSSHQRPWPPPPARRRRPSGSAGPGWAWPGRMWSGRAGPDAVRPGRAVPDSVRNVAAAASPRQPAAPPTAFGCGRGGAKPARGRRSAKQNKVCTWFDVCVQ